MARTPVMVVPSPAGGSAAGILLLLVAVVGLLALFTGNLESLIGRIAGPAGGAAGIYNRESGGRLVGGSWGEPTPAPGAPAPSSRDPVPR